MLKRIRFTSIFSKLSLFITATAAAASQAQSINLGSGWAFTPTLSFDVSYDDNISSAVEDKVDSWLSITNPRFLLESDRGSATYSVQYSLAYNDYLDSSRKSFTDHELNANGSWDISDSANIAIGAAYLDILQEFNARVAQNLDTLIFERDNYTDTDVYGTYTYGAEGAFANLSFTVGTRRRNYMDETRARDREGNYASAVFTLNVTRRTSLITQVDGQEIQYDSTGFAFPDRDSREVNYMVGVGRVDGTLNVRALGGMGTRKFKHLDSEDYSWPAWEALATWTPSERGALTLSTERRAIESLGEADFIDAKSAALAWEYSWTARVSTNIAYRFTRAESEGIDARQDIQRGAVRVNYQLLNRLSLHAELVALDQNSSSDSFSYGRNQAFLGFELSL